MYRKFESFLSNVASSLVLHVRGARIYEAKTAEEVKFAGYRGIDCGAPTMVNSRDVTTAEVL